MDVSGTLFVISSLAPSGAARQLYSLATALPRERVRICVLGAGSAWSDDLRRSGVKVEVLSWDRPIDLRPIFSLISVLRSHRGTLCAWDATAARTLLLAGFVTPSRMLIANALAPGRQASGTVWMLRRCRRVLAFGAAEAAEYRQVGVPPERIAVIPPGLPPGGESGSSVDYPSEYRVVLCAGPIALHKGHREAAWAFDMVRYQDERLRLVIVGTGPAEDRARRFAMGTRVDRFVSWTGPVEDMAGWLARAEIVWVPSLRNGGRMFALEAMAAGKPVVASAVPMLAEVVRDGETGLLVTPSDKLGLARATRRLIDDVALGDRLGQAARVDVQTRFPLAATVRELGTVL